jgi:hypothetical protein
MRFNGRMKRLAASVVVVGAVLGGAVLTAAPASAAPKCASVYWSGGIASTSCSGTGKVRLVYQCKAYLGFPSWTKYGAWVTFRGEKNRDVTQYFTSCGGTDKAWAQVQ